MDKRLLIFGGIGLVLLCFLAVVFGARNVNTAKLKISVAPSGAEIKIDSTGVSEGVSSLKPGKVHVIVSKTGFATSTQTVTAIKGQTQFVGIALSPNSPETLSWYKDHPEDQKKAESISSKNFDISSQQSVTNVPFIKKLPYIGAGFEFRIDYGAGPKDDLNHPIVYIDARNPQARRDALSWILHQGYDVSDFKVIFTTAEGTLE